MKTSTTMKTPTVFFFLTLYEPAAPASSPRSPAPHQPFVPCTDPRPPPTRKRFFVIRRETRAAAARAT